MLEHGIIISKAVPPWISTATGKRPFGFRGESVSHSFFFA